MQGLALQDFSKCFPALSGKSKGKAVKGAGYVEMTGYAQKFASKI